MIIYNVTVKVSHDIVSDWLSWMQTVHIPEVMETKLFLRYQLCHLFDYDDEDGQNYTIQYYCEDLDIYLFYATNIAPTLQQKHIERYGDKAVAFRTLMRVIA